MSSTARKAYACTALSEAPMPKRNRLKEVISFFDADFEGVRMFHDNVVVVSMTITNFN